MEEFTVSWVSGVQLTILELLLLLFWGLGLCLLTAEVDGKK